MRRIARSALRAATPASTPPGPPSSNAGRPLRLAREGGSFINYVFNPSGEGLPGSRRALAFRNPRNSQQPRAASPAGPEFHYGRIEASAARTWLPGQAGLGRAQKAALPELEATVNTDATASLGTLRADCGCAAVTQKHPEHPEAEGGSQGGSARECWACWHPAAPGNSTAPPQPSSPGQQQPPAP